MTKSESHEFRIDIAQADHYSQNGVPERTHWNTISVYPGIVSLDPTQVARVAYDGKAWVFECQSAAKEAIVFPLNS